MAFMDTDQHFRSNEDIDSKLKQILVMYPDKYETESHVIRCAIIKLWCKEVNDGREPVCNSET